MGNIKLMHGDCLELMNDIPDGSVDLILCDLPYGTTTCKWDVIIPFGPLWKQYKRILKPKGVVVLFGSQPFTTRLISANSPWFKYCWIWDKKRPSNPMLAKKQALKVHEDICVFYETLGTYNPQGLLPTNGKARGGVKPSKTALGFGEGIKEDYKQEFYNYPKSILEFGTDNSKNVHPTQKPTTLLEYLIKTYTLEGETVLDNCMGSGSTGIACINTNRNFIGIEKDDKYFEIASARIKESISLIVK